MDFDDYKCEKKKEQDKLELAGVLKMISEKKDIDYTPLIEKLLTKEVDLVAVVKAIREIPQAKEVDLSPVTKAIKDIPTPKDTVVNIPENKPDVETHKLLKGLLDELKKEKKPKNDEDKKLLVKVIKELGDKVEEMAKGTEIAFSSSVAPDVVGSKNIAGETINPATEEGQADALLCCNKGVPATFIKQTANSEDYLIQKGQLNKCRIRPRILNEHVESSREVQSIVTATNVVGQIFKASHDNINGIHLAMESAAGSDFDDFESYADSAALQAAWIATGSGGQNDAELETTIFHEGSQAMLLDIDDDGAVGDEWARATTIGLSGDTAEFWVYSNKEYKDIKMRAFLEDSIGNTSSAPIVQADKDVWTKIVIPSANLIADGATPVDLTDVVKIGFRVEKEKKDGLFYVDDIIAVPPGGEVDIKLWDMGATIPTEANSIDDGTQYEKLGDLGITGTQVSQVRVELLGGFRVYPIKTFVAGTSLEIPTNELLNVGHYYAITVNYVSTDVSVYGASSSYGEQYYENGFAFTAPDEATTITKLGEFNHIMFAIFSTQDVYIINMQHRLNAVPNGDSNFNVYTEDENMRRDNTLIASISGIQLLMIENLVDMPAFMMKGGKLEEEYNDDFSDDVIKLVLSFRYLYEPIPVNG